jgi:hypothetical protein
MPKREMFELTRNTLCLAPGAGVPGVPEGGVLLDVDEVLHAEVQDSVQRDIRGLRVHERRSEQARNGDSKKRFTHEIPPAIGR